MTTPPAATPLQLVTLGALGVYAEGRAEPLVAPGKPFALLAYLALTPGRRVSREFLLDLLWADLDPERARAALRQLLFHLRRLLGESALPGVEELSLSLEIDVDRDRFLGALERGDLETAFDAYTGPFLHAFGVPGGAAFEQWADLERDRLRAAFLRTGELLIRRHLGRSQLREAQRKARRLRDEAPEAEAAWRLSLETVVAGRDFVTAVMDAERLEQWAREMGIQLEPATRAIIAAARQVQPAPSEGADEGALVAELTGREREFFAITSAWESVKEGSPRHLHLTAAAGLGKTRLLRDAVARLRAAGAAVAEVRGSPGERDIAGAFAADVASALSALPGAAGIAPGSAAALVALNPALSSRLSAAPDPARGEEAGRRRLLALVDLVHAVADEQPFVLVVDDVHWVDQASFRMLEGMLARLAPARVLCLTAARPERPLSAELTRQLPLAPLTQEHLASLVAALGALPDAGWAAGFVAGLHRATRGSPLLVLETLRLALDQSILLLEEGSWLCADPARLGALLSEGEALRSRVRALPDDQVRVLGVLALAGTALPADGIPEGSAEALAGLERLGLITRGGDQWQTAHDEIAAVSREALPPEVRAHLEADLGAGLIARAGSNAHLRLRGIRHLVAAGRSSGAREEFRRYARMVREQKDRRSFPELAAEVLSRSADSAEARALADAVPLPWRVGLWSPVRQTLAAAGVMTVLLGATAAVRARSAHDAALQRVTYLDSSGAVTTVAVDPSRWQGSSEPVVPARGRSTITEAALGFGELWPMQRPDAGAVAWNRNMGDSTTIDIWMGTGRDARRLTHEIRDDLVTGWTPDGSALIGLTNRWSPVEEGGYDVAVFDTASGAARPVSVGPGHSGGAHLSPDGTRVAFLHESNDATAQFCVSPFDGEDPPRCGSIAGFPLLTMVEWSSPTEVIVVIDSGAVRPLVAYDVTTNGIRPLLGRFVRRVQVSPDRQWIAAEARSGGMAPWREWIVPVNRPTQGRPVAEVSGMVRRWWEGRGEPAEMVDRVEFTDSASTILPEVGTRLGIRALSRDGAELPILAPVRWHSSDTLVAVVDHEGVVRARRGGRVRIEASLAGWRKAWKDVVVYAKAPTTVFEEDWDGAWQSRWFSFGTPQPEVVLGRDGVHAFWNRGDGTYPSIGVSRRSFPAGDGLGLEVMMSTPITRSNWQRTFTLLVAGVDTSRFTGADQERDPPVTMGDYCGALYPERDGPLGANWLGLSGGIPLYRELGPVGKQMASGQWWRLRLQIFPDGRCGVAVNGEALLIASEPVPVGREYRLWFGYESVETRNLHGPLQVWTGVRTDVDWARAGMSP